MTEELSSYDPATPERLLVAAVDALGGVVEPRGPGLADLLVPAPLLPVSQGRELLTVAFGPEALMHGPEAELATVGTPLLDRLTDFLLSQGTTGCATVPVERLHRGGIENRVGDVIAFVKCRTGPGSLPQDGVLCAYAQFDFKVTLTADDRREKLVTVLVDLRTNLPSPELEERLPQLSLTTAPPPSLVRKRIDVPVEDAYRTAQVHLGEIIAPDVRTCHTRLQRRLLVELARISDFYTDSVTDLRVRMEQAVARGDSPASFEDRIQATLRERERKLQETADHYRLRCRARLLHARVLHQPKLSFSVLVERKKLRRELELFYDPVLDRMEPVLCDLCRGVAHELTLTDDLRFACSRCTGKSGWKCAGGGRPETAQSPGSR